MIQCTFSIIGDHQQLRPAPKTYELARKCGLDVSMFERAVNNRIQLTRLRMQHRMHPSIAKLICPHIYPDLINHDSVLNYPPILGVKRNLFFLTHTYAEAEVSFIFSSNGQLLSFFSFANECFCHRNRTCGVERITLKRKSSWRFVSDYFGRVHTLLTTSPYSPLTAVNFSCSRR